MTRLRIQAFCVPDAALLTKMVGAGKPDILFFLADDWGRNASCCRDPARSSINDVIETGNMDRVAREGVLFRNTFLGIFSCRLARASSVTGSCIRRCKKAFLGGGEGWRGFPDPDSGGGLTGFGEYIVQVAADLQ